MQTLTKTRTIKKSPKSRGSDNNESTTTEAKKYSIGETEIVITPGSFADVNRHLLGSVKSGVPDLATNTEYMSDFGISHKHP